MAGGTGGCNEDGRELTAAVIALVDLALDNFHRPD
jgi:hypothetical protein